MSYVYFIFEVDSDICKIGKSTDPEKRLKTLQTGKMSLFENKQMKKEEKLKEN